MAYVANAWKRTQRSKAKDDSPVSAGVGKAPSQTVTNKNELEELGERMGWKVRPLTEKEIRGEMSGQELIWHETFSPDEVEKALALPAQIATNKQNMAAWDAKRMYEGGATEEESQKAFAAGEKFALSYSQFIRSESNALAVLSYMRDNNLDATNVQSYIQAYEALVPQGKLVLSPKAAGIGTEEILTGDELRGYARLNLLLQPNKALKPQDRLSADQWFEKHKEILGDKRTPPLIAARQARVDATVAHFQQAAEHTSKANVVSVTDYPDEPSGYLTHCKYTFRKFVAGLSAADFQEKLNDPTFVAALDRTSDGNK